MPELPEVETLRRSLEIKLVGLRIDGVQVRETRLRHPVQEERLREGVSGRRFEGFSRRSKYLLCHLEDGFHLVIHLGMSGRLMVMPADVSFKKHEHVIFALDDGSHLRFSDHRRFGLVDLVGASELATYPSFAALGLEPLSAEFTGDFLFEISRGSKKPIKNFLMDATRVVGVGNIYASEALFMARIKPTRAAGRLTKKECGQLVRCVRKVLTTAIEKGGTTINDFFDSDGHQGNFQFQLRVYDRHREPCRRCKTPIRRKILAGRSTFYCPACQR